MNPYLPDGNNHLPGGPFQPEEELCIYTMGDTKCYYCGECGKKARKCIIKGFFCNNCGNCIIWE